VLHERREFVERMNLLLEKKFENDICLFALNKTKINSKIDYNF
jgi:hypothetical protein